MFSSHYRGGSAHTKEADPGGGLENWKKGDDSFNYFNALEKENGEIR